MLLTELSLGDAQVITISGRFDRNHEVALETALWQAEQKGCRQVIFNLENLSSMDKVGIGNIMFAYYGLKRKGILLSLVNPRPSVHKVLQFVELTLLLPIFNSMDEAVFSSNHGLSSEPRNFGVRVQSDGQDDPVELRFNGYRPGTESRAGAKQRATGLIFEYFNMEATSYQATPKDLKGWVLAREIKEKTFERVWKAVKQSEKVEKVSGRVWQLKEQYRCSVEAA